jgi:basic membrane protein A
MSYNDCILEGVQKFKMEHKEIDIYIYSPESLLEAEKIFSDWLKRPESEIPVLFCFG